MGIRNRGYVVNYYIPLFAGVDAAKRASGRLTFPPDLYHPGDGDDGGLGGDQEIDLTISTPSITYPSLAEDVVETTESATSSAFASDNGQTHTASRWLIEVAAMDGVNPTAEGTGFFLFDSGVDTVNLTSLPFADVGMAPGTAYIITVRYRGSNGGWGDWALPVVFSLLACEGEVVVTPPDTDPDDDSGAADMTLWFDAADAATITHVAGAISQWDDKSISGSDAIQSDGTLKPTLKTDKFVLGAVEFTGGRGLSFTDTSVAPGTVFLVVDWIQSAVRSGVGLMHNDMTTDDFVGALSTTTPVMEPSTGHFQTGSGAGEGLRSALNSLPSGQYVLEFVLTTSPASSYLFVNGANAPATYFGTGWTISANRMGLQSLYLGGGNQIAEARAYNTVLSDADRATRRAWLADKWGITL